ncbi:helix-turn-helix domain-containing protein [Actinoallomurus sp. NPDC050550]|uniref:AraC-like ligand-binding domain-containing protein n=1 Tax=Actinoallomurus sp. NPDC050550 TaxID=3154937 RepID=UPI0033ED0621
MGVLIAESVDAWAQVITESFVPLSLGSVDGSFRGSVSAHALGPAVTLTEVRTRGFSVVVRSARLVRAEPRDDYLFSLHLDGEGAVLQDGREAGLPCGGGALYDASRPYQLRFPTDTRQLVLQMPRDQLRDRVGRAEEFCGRALPAEHPAVRVLAAYVRELADTSDGLTGALRAELGATAVDLLTTALRAVAGEESGAPSGRAALLAAMRAHVRDHLADPRLSAEALARRHGVSLRYTAELFAADGTSPAAFIRAERLRAAHRALTDPRYAGLTVSAVAARYGFADRTTFTRAFVRAYSRTPAELRAAHGSEA